MAKDAVVSEELANKFPTEKDTPYLRWVRGEGLDIIGAHYVPNLRTVELKPWPRREPAKASSSTTRRRAPPTTATSARSRPGKSSRRSGSSTRR